MEDKLKKGETLFADGKIDEAEEFFLSAVEKDNNNKEAYNNLGVIAFKKEDVNGAIDYFTRALEIDYSYKDAVLNYADLLRTLNQLHIAIPLLEKILEVDPHDKEISQLLKDAQELQHYHVNIKGAESSDKAELSSCEVAHFSSLKENQNNGNDILSGKKILHAPFEIAGNMARITRYLRRHNVSASSANYYDSWLRYKCDINLNINNLPESERFKTIDNFAKDAIEKYDIFHFHFAHSLYPDFRDLEELKQRDKKILFSFWGSDQRSPEWILYQQAKFLGYNPPKPYFITIDQYHAHKIINRYADVMLGSECIPRGLWIPGQIDISQWNLEEKEQLLKEKTIEKNHKKTYFLHAPSTNWKKGTLIIFELLEECRNDGMPIEILYVSKIPQEKAKKIYAYADFAIDQIGVGTFGLFGIEMMSWQIPVLTYQTDLFDKIRNYPPVIKIRKENFRNQIARCIEMKESGENIELGKMCRQWVMENADMASKLPEYLKIYRDLAKGRRIVQYVNNSWYQQEYLLQRGVKSEFYRYMIKENVFKKIKMKTPDYDKRLYL